MGRGNTHVIPIHRHLKAADNRRLMAWEQDELTYDESHGYPRIDDWGTLVEPVDEQAKRAKLDAAIKQLKPWWLRWMVRFGEWMGWGA